MTATFAHDPGSQPAFSKLDDAIDRGFDPGEDYGRQPVADPDAPLSPRIVRWVHQGSPEGCQDCGERCDTCDDRMCSHWGPEPRACGTTCGDCPCSCTSCAEAAQDRQDDRAYEIARDSR